jgi:hypothetical protein
VGLACAEHRGRAQVIYRSKGTEDRRSQDDVKTRLATVSALATVIFPAAIAILVVAVHRKYQNPRLCKNASSDLKVSMLAHYLNMVKNSHAVTRAAGVVAVSQIPPSLQSR